MSKRKEATMSTVSVEISYYAISKRVRSLLWKYASAIEGADNYRQVYNVKHDPDDEADDTVLQASFNARVDELVLLSRDFSPEKSTGGQKNLSGWIIEIEVSDRWAGDEDTLLSLFERYIIDGVMADWLSVTSPQEAQVYTARLVADTDAINTELYTKTGA